MPSLPRAAKSGRSPQPGPQQARQSSPDSARYAAASPPLDEVPLDARDSPLPRLPTPDRPPSGAGFNKMRAARNASTPVTGARQDRRFWPRDTRGLLEICEQGYALQQGMKAHCQESADILE